MKKFINACLVLVCVIHIGIILKDELYPESPSIRTFVKDLKEIEFPFSFKLCITSSTIEEMIRENGYNSTGDFFGGKSKYNGSLWGWKGHAKNHSSLLFLEGENDWKKSKVSIIHLSFKI